MYKDITEHDIEKYNYIVGHPLQSYEWGEFRKKTGVKVIRRGYFENDKLTSGFTVTIHKIPKTKLTIGYLPKGDKPTAKLLLELKRLGKEQNCIFIQLEPNVIQNSKFKIQNSDVRSSFHPLFTKFTFVLDITKSEEELLKNFHSKTRYNIKVAQKNNVIVAEDTSDKGFLKYLQLTEETTRRQRFYAHTPSYHKKMWETLSPNPTTHNLQPTTSLSAHLLRAIYKPDDGKEQTLASWVLFIFKDHLYYPYGASSSQFRNVMASNLIMWEAIRFGKKMGLRYFDMWGALGKEPDTKDAWYGFHKFKEGYGATHTEFVGSYDFVINPTLYHLYKVADKARWLLLHLKKRSA